MTDDQPNYGNMVKKVVFEETDHQHAKFIIRLRHSSISQVDFFRAIVDGFVKNDDRVCSYIDEYTKEQKMMNTQRIEKSKMLKNSGQQKIENFALSKKDIEDIFDTLEEELPEL